MRKIILFILMSVFFTQAFAINPADNLNKVSDNFKPECYEYYNKIDKANVWNNNSNWKYQTYKLNIEKAKNLVINQNWFIIPYKYLDNPNNNFSYKNKNWVIIKESNDLNKKTYLELDTWKSKEIIFEFIDDIKKNTFTYENSIKSEYNKINIFISEDWENFSKVSENNISDFDLKFLKLEAICHDEKNCNREIIKINELNLINNYSTILIKSFFNENVEIYSNFNCKNKNFITNALKYENFDIDTDTKLITIKAENNPKYNVYSKKDYDNDWIEDELDNCKYRYNPNQADKNWDGKWDICSDDDNDWKIWYYDNCIYVYNPKQEDINVNWVWDRCEFDKDKDWIYDSIDNCRNIYNPDQKDDDKDNIWNLCDNSIYYNPSQLDKNNNWIWDISEEKETRIKENDIDLDKIIDSKDNCKEIANFDQVDTDKDWVWNVCDNSEYYNPDQLDENNNWIWDISEDSDNDWIIWINDNCINISNKNQEDRDNDWVWNLCEDKDNDKILEWNDNCPYEYNPDQMDIDWDLIWDKCDKEDGRYIESNSSFFIWVLVFITLIFWGWIYIMIRKLK